MLNIITTILISKSYCDPNWMYQQNSYVVGAPMFMEQNQPVICETCMESEDDTAECTCNCNKCSGPEECCQILCAECRVNRPQVVVVPYPYPVIVQPIEDTIQPIIEDTTPNNLNDFTPSTPSTKLFYVPNIEIYTEPITKSTTSNNVNKLDNCKNDIQDKFQRTNEKFNSYEEYKKSSKRELYDILDGQNDSGTVSGHIKIRHTIPLTRR